MKRYLQIKQQILVLHNSQISENKFRPKCAMLDFTKEDIGEQQLWVI